MLAGNNLVSVAARGKVKGVESRTEQDP